MARTTDTVNEDYQIELISIANLIIEAPMATKLKMVEILREKFSHEEAAMEMAEHIEKLAKLDGMIN